MDQIMFTSLVRGMNPRFGVLKSNVITDDLLNIFNC